MTSVMIDAFLFLLAFFGSVLILFWLVVTAVLAPLGFYVARQAYREARDTYRARSEAEDE